jgi:exonuclease III
MTVGGGNIHKIVNNMRIMMWNVRGLRKAARRRQVREYDVQHRIDLVDIQDVGGNRNNQSGPYSPSRLHFNIYRISAASITYNSLEL